MSPPRTPQNGHPLFRSLVKRTRGALAGGVPLLALSLLACTAPVLPAHAADKEPAMQPIIHAPDFPKEFAWLNTDQPLSFAGNLKGQVVLMDFWTYCCINCMHVLPELETLEQKYKNDPVVILGVHSAKYDNEEDSANIRAAIQRYQIHHPVLVDEHHRVWDTYDVHSWPTIIVVGADGHIIGGISGEGHLDVLDKTIAKALAEGKANGTLAKAPLRLAHEGQVRAATGLSFPGKIIADPANKRLLIVDSNHNRIVITTYPGGDGNVSVQQVIGSGQTGAADGDFTAASFNRPQGATLGGGGNTLWIADTENHLIRRADLDKKTVTTVLGNGKQTFDNEAGKTGRQQGLNSPWDLAIFNNRLYISQAGQHQLFAMNLMSYATEAVAGTARENILDGPAKSANLAQPSGLALDAANKILYFADSEVSAIRGLNLTDNRVFTVIGHGLFDFGDIDGDAKTARLQHALGVALSADGKKLFVADTYNHKVKVLDPAARTATTLAGNSKSGTGMPGTPLQFFEPSAVSVGGPHDLFVADTNNHRIVRLDPENGAWKELVINGLDAPGSAELATDKDAKDLGPKTLAAGKALSLKFQIQLPANNHLTDGAPISLKVTDGQKTIYTTTLSAPASSTLTIATAFPTKPTLHAVIPADALSAAPKELYVMAYYTHCADGPSAVCVPAKSSWKLTPTFNPQAPETLDLAP